MLLLFIVKNMFTSKLFTCYNKIKKVTVFLQSNINFYGDDPDIAKLKAKEKERVQKIIEE
jgi:hypothetical protein